jgi:hypothetical protein
MRGKWDVPEVTAGQTRSNPVRPSPSQSERVTPNRHWRKIAMTDTGDTRAIQSNSEFFRVISWKNPRSKEILFSASACLPNNSTWTQARICRTVRPILAGAGSPTSSNQVRLSQTKIKPHATSIGASNVIESNGMSYTNTLLLTGLRRFSIVRSKSSDGLLRPATGRCSY